MADLKLNIYDHKEVVKTFEGNLDDVSYGFWEDLFEVLPLDSLDDETKVLQICMSFVKSSKIYPILSELFEDFTEEDLKKSKLSEVTSLIYGLVSTGFLEISKNLNNSKNMNQGTNE